METSTLNRNESFKKAQPKLSEKRQLLLNVLKLYPKGLTSEEIVDKTKMPINQVSGRLSELKSMFYISGDGSKRCIHTGNYRTIWRVTNSDWRIFQTNKAFVELRTQKDQLVRDKNRGVSTYTFEVLKKEIRRIDRLINQLA
jgi:hypothetical protein|tara:strand:+ start:617 stop:1042 length:426 start_codon:yes stop_codon:yes gene_type:complete